MASESFCSPSASPILWIMPEPFCRRLLCFWKAPACVFHWNYTNRHSSSCILDIQGLLGCSSSINSTTFGLVEAHPSRNFVNRVVRATPLMQSSLRKPFLLAQSLRLTLHGWKYLSTSPDPSLVLLLLKDSSSSCRITSPSIQLCSWQIKSPRRLSFDGWRRSLVFLEICSKSAQTTALNLSCHNSQTSLNCITLRMTNRLYTTHSLMV